MVFFPHSSRRPMMFFPHSSGRLTVFPFIPLDDCSQLCEGVGVRECWRAGLLPVPVGVTDTLRPDSRLDDHGLLLLLFCHLPLIHSCEVDVDVGAPMDTWPPEVVQDDPQCFPSFLWTTTVFCRIPLEDLRRN